MISTRARRSTDRRTRTGSTRPAGSATARRNPATCNDTFGTRAPAAGGTALGAGSSPVRRTRRPLTGLTPGTTYYFCAIAANASGTAFGAVLSFTTPRAARRDDHGGDRASRSTTRDAQRLGEPERRATTGWFRYGTTNPGTLQRHVRHARAGRRRRGARRRVDAPVAVLAGRSRACCRRPPTTSARSPQNGLGTAFGAVLSFTTTPPRRRSRRTAATSVDQHRGDAQRLGQPERGRGHRLVPLRHDQPRHVQRHLRHARAGGRRHRARRRAQRRPVLAGAHRPAPGTTYYFCAIASNSVGTSFGAVLSFTTPAAPDGDHRRRRPA